MNIYEIRTELKDEYPTHKDMFDAFDDELIMDFYDMSIEEQNINLQRITDKWHEQTYI